MSRSASSTCDDPWRWVVLFVFCFFSSSNAIQWITYSSIAIPSRAFFHLTTTQLNLLSSVYMIVFAVGAFFTCTTFERWGARLGVLIGCSLNALGSILKVAPGLQFPSYTTVLIPQILNSFAQLFVLSTPPLIAAQYFPPKKRGFATAIASTSNSIGNAIALFVPPLIVKSGTQGEFMLLFCLEMGYCVLVLIGAVFFFKPPRFKAPSVALLSTAVINGPSVPADASCVNGADGTQGQTNSVSHFGGVHSCAGPPTETAVATSTCPDEVGGPAHALPKRSANGRHPHNERESNAGDHRSERGSESKRKEMSCIQRLWSGEQIIIFVEVGHTIWKLLRCRSFMFLFIAFSIGMGSVWTFASVLAQILEPFGVTESLAGIAGALNIIIGTVAAYVVCLWVDRYRRYKIPLLVCFIGSVVSCFALMMVMLKVSPNTHVMNGLACFIYVVAGIFQNTAIPLCFEFAMEITYPLYESVPAALLMAGANVVSLILLSVSSAMMGAGTTSPAAAMHVVIMITCVCGLGTVLVALPRERLKRYIAEQTARYPSHTGGIADVLWNAPTDTQHDEQAGVDRAHRGSFSASLPHDSSVHLVNTSHMAREL